MRRGTLVNPILFGVAHAASTRDLPLRTGPVRRTTLRTVAERLCAVAPHGRVPVVHDYLDRHPAAPDAYGALRTVGSRIKATMAAGPVDWQVRWNTQPRRTRTWFLWHALLDRKLADLVELDALKTRVYYRKALPADLVSDLELMLVVSPLPDANQEISILPADRSVYAKCIAEVGMAAFVKGPCEAYSWLN